MDAVWMKHEQKAVVVRSGNVGTTVRARVSHAHRHRLSREQTLRLSLIHDQASWRHSDGPLVRARRTVAEIFPSVGVAWRGTACRTRVAIRARHQGRRERVAGNQTNEGESRLTSALSTVSACWSKSVWRPPSRARSHSHSCSSSSSDSLPPPPAPLSLAPALAAPTGAPPLPTHPPPSLPRPSKTPSGAVAWGKGRGVQSDTGTRSN